MSTKNAKKQSTKKSSKKESTTKISDNQKYPVVFHENLKELEDKLNKLLNDEPSRTIMKNVDYEELCKYLGEAVNARIHYNIDKNGTLCLSQAYAVHKILATRWCIDPQTNQPIRQVKEFYDWSSKKIGELSSKEFDERRMALMCRIEADGWCLEDMEAYLDAVRYIEKYLDKKSHELYYEPKVCRKCLAKRMRLCADHLRELREFLCDRANIIDKLAEANCEVPAILPVDYNNWDIKNGEYVRVKSDRPDVSIREIKLDDKGKEIVNKLISAIEGTKE